MRTLVFLMFDRFDAARMAQCVLFEDLSEVQPVFANVENLHFRSGEASIGQSKTATLYRGTFRAFYDRSIDRLGANVFAFHSAESIHPFEGHILSKHRFLWFQYSRLLGSSSAEQFYVASYIHRNLH